MHRVLSLLALLLASSASAATWPNFCPRGHPSGPNVPSADTCSPADGVSPCVPGVTPTCLSAKTWTSVTAPFTNVYSLFAIALSQSGATMAATDNNGGDGTDGDTTRSVWVSSDTGATWSANAPPETYGNVQVSSNGLVIAALWSALTLAQNPHINQGVALSTNGGATWSTPIFPFTVGLGANDILFALGMSGDGQKLITTTGGTGLDQIPLYLSLDGSATWNQFYAGSNIRWKLATISRDGSTIVVAKFDANTNTYHLYKSTNNLVSLTEISPPIVLVSPQNYQRVFVSDDGTKMALWIDGAEPGGPSVLYYSSNGGSTWVQRSAFPSASAPQLMSTSGDLTTMMGRIQIGNNIIISCDSGVTWTVMPQTQLPDSIFAQAINAAGTVAGATQAPGGGSSVWTAQ